MSKVDHDWREVTSDTEQVTIARVASVTSAELAVRILDTDAAAYWGNRSYAPRSRQREGASIPPTSSSSDAPSNGYL